MASLSVSSSQNSLYLSFTGLTHPDGDYDQFAFEVDGNIHNTYSNGSDFTGLSCGTGYVCAGAAKYDGVWYTIESGVTHYTSDCPAGPTRPSNFSGWGISVVAGEDCAVTDTKWLEFQDKINEFRDYKGLSAYSFTKGSFVVTGETIYFWLANQLVNSMSGLGVSPPSTVSSLDDFTADWLNQLMNALNSTI